MGSPNTLLNRLKEVDYTQAGDRGGSTNGATIYPDRQFAVVRLISAGAETRTVSAPRKSGIIFTLDHVTDGGDITVTVTGGYDEAGSMTLTFSAIGQFATLISVEQTSGTFVWRILAYDGVAGPTVSLASLALTGSLSVGTTSTLTGAVTGASSIKSTNATAGVGYGTGAGGAVTQITSASTGVTLNKVTGQITTVALTTAAAAEERFTVTNSAVAATDTIVLGTTYNGAGTAILSVQKIAAGAFDVVISNVHAANAFDALMVINFTVIKGVAA